jgi:hypothetical protein
MSSQVAPVPELVSEINLKRRSVAVLIEKDAAYFSQYHCN